MRWVLGFGMLAYAAFMVRHLILSQRRWRQQVAEYKEQARIADLPDDEFVAWALAKRDAENGGPT